MSAPAHSNSQLDVDRLPEELPALLAALLEARPVLPVGLARQAHDLLSACAPFRLDEHEGELRFRTRFPWRAGFERRVWIDYRPGGKGAHASCSCARFAEARRCGHQWAALTRLHELLQARLEPGTPAPRRASWRQSLRVLDRLIAARAETDDSPDAPEARTRVAWRVAWDDHKLGLEAYEQQRRSNGGFTPGRKMALEQLSWRTQQGNASRELRAVGRAILRENAGFRAYRQRLTLAAAPALLALVGSPRVAWAHEPRRAVRVRRGALGLQVAAQEDGSLELRPTFGRRALTADVFLDAERSLLILVVLDEDEVVVGPVDPRLLDAVAELTQVPHRLPVEARPVLLERLSRLESVLPVALPPELRGAPREADAQLHLLLGPTPAGIQVEARVRPFRDAPRLVPGCGPSELGAWIDGQRVLVQRDRRGERRRAREQVQDLGLATQGGGDAEEDWTWDLEGDAALGFIARLQGEEREDLQVEWRDERVRVSLEARPVNLRVQVLERRDWFGVEGVVEIGGWRVQLAEIINSLQDGRRFVPLKGGRWLQISDELRQRLQALREVAHPRHGTLEVDATAAPAVDELVDRLDQVELVESWQAVRQRLERARRVTKRLPAGLRAELRPYQREGYLWLKRLATWGVGACLADDMGLGKTVQAIALLLQRAKQGPALVVAPTSVAGNWRRELERFAPGLRAILYRETKRAERVARLRARDVLIVSYDLARIDAQVLGSRSWGTLVFDEAQQVKNANTKTAKALRGLDGGWRLALTGTPVENHLGELWSLFRLISPGVLGSWEAFRKRWAIPIERDKSAEHRAALAKLIRPFVLRRTKGEVLTDLPGRTEITLDVALDGREQAAYEDARLAAVAELSRSTAERKRRRKQGEDGRFQVLAALTRLRQLACHPRLVDPGWRGDSAKLRAFLELVEGLRESGHRALVFSQFTSYLALVREALDARGLAYHYLDGRTPARTRERIIDAFQRGEGGDLFLISLKAGGKGLNLTAADYVVHLDPWWNPAVEDQATDRAHRIGQTRPVTVYRLVARGTVEEQILDLHAAKRDLVEGILEGSDRAGKLSTEELIALVRAGAPRLEPGDHDWGDEGESEKSDSDSESDSEAESDSDFESDSDSESDSEAESDSDFESDSEAETPGVPPLLAGSVLKRERARLRLSQRAMGRLLGVSGSTISQWENEQRQPHPQACRAIAALVGLDRYLAERRLNTLP